MVPSVASVKGSMAATAAWSSWAEGRAVSWAQPVPLMALVWWVRGGGGEGSCRSQGCLGGWKLCPPEIRSGEGRVESHGITFTGARAATPPWVWGTWPRSGLGRLVFLKWKLSVSLSPTTSVSSFSLSPPKLTVCLSQSQAGGGVEPEGKWGGVVSLRIQG